MGHLVELKRTWRCDVRVCLPSHGTLDVRAVISAPLTVAAVLASLARPRGPPARDASTAAPPPAP